MKQFKLKDSKSFRVFFEKASLVKWLQRPRGGEGPGGFHVAAAASGRGEIPTASGGGGQQGLGKTWGKNVGKHQGFSHNQADGFSV